MTLSVLIRCQFNETFLNIETNESDMLSEMLGTLHIFEIQGVHTMEELFFTNLDEVLPPFVHFIG